MLTRKQRDDIHELSMQRRRMKTLGVGDLSKERARLEELERERELEEHSHSFRIPAE